MAGCTLTDDPFEPSSVDRVGSELNPEGPGGGAPSSDEATAPSVTPGGSSGSEATGDDGSDDEAGGDGSEPDLGSVPLDPSDDVPSDNVPSDNVPSDNGGGGRPGTGSDSSAGQNGGDAGVGPDVGSESPDVDVAPEPPLTPACPGSEFGGSCYQAFAELASWDIAEQRCLAWGGHLASVQSLDEDEFLDDWPAQLGITFADGSGIWLGGTDADVEGDFRWLDDSSLSFLGWAPNQPDNGPGLDCIEKRNDGTALWYDRRCADALPYLCERPL
jgi:hypothetical protein